MLQMPGLDLSLTDATGKQLPALHVFSECIRFLKNEVVQTTERFFEESMCRWVITIPATWNERVKLFMWKAALEVI